MVHWRYLGGALREKNAGRGFGRRKNFLNQDTIEGWNQALRHTSVLEELGLLSSGARKRMESGVCFNGKEKEVQIWVSRWE